MSCDTLILLSGGLDSATLLATSIANNQSPLALTFDYGQSHSREIEVAQSLARFYGVEWTLIDISASIQRIGVSSALLSTSENTFSVVVPGRNSIFLAFAGATAIARGIQTVAIACNMEDWEEFPDCRPEYLLAMSEVFRLFDNFQVKLLYPFSHFTKSEIISLGIIHNVPFERTLTCYAGREKACGKCYSCLGRLRAFRALGMEDPLEYESI